jgi:GMP synthase-like glutamine amidotransferase
VARNSVYTQAFRLGHSLGVEFHPEMTTATVRRYLELGGSEQCMRRGVDPGGLLARTRELESTAPANAHRLVDAFLDRVTGRAG